MNNQNKVKLEEKAEEKGKNEKKDEKNNIATQNEKKRTNTTAYVYRYSHIF